MFYTARFSARDFPSPVAFLHSALGGISSIHASGEVTFLPVRFAFDSLRRVCGAAFARLFRSFSLSHTRTPRFGFVFLFLKKFQPLDLTNRSAWVPSRTPRSHTCCFSCLFCFTQIRSCCVPAPRQRWGVPPKVSTRCHPRAHSQIVHFYRLVGACMAIRNCAFCS